MTSGFPAGLPRNGGGNTTPKSRWGTTPWKRITLAPSLESNITLHTLLYAFRGQVIDAAGNVTVGKTAFTVEALKYVKALYEDAGTPDQLAWGPSGNVRAMLARKTSATVNAINLLRTAEREEPEVASKIRLSPPLLGSA